MELLTQDFLKQFTDEEGNIDFESANKALANTVQEDFINPTVKKVKSKMVDKAQAQTPQVQESQDLQSVFDRIAQLEGELTTYKSEQTTAQKTKALRDELISKGADAKRVDSFLKHANIETVEIDDDMLEMLSQTQGKPKFAEEGAGQDNLDDKEVGSASDLMNKLRLKRK